MNTNYSKSQKWHRKGFCVKRKKKTEVKSILQYQREKKFPLLEVLKLLLFFFFFFLAGGRGEPCQSFYVMLR